jgi:hypothetical protein
MATTLDRVPAHTSNKVNQKIEAEIAENVQRFAAQPQRIPARLIDLAKEWDIERAIEANASARAFIGGAGLFHASLLADPPGNGDRLPLPARHPRLVSANPNSAQSVSRTALHLIHLSD